MRLKNYFKREKIMSDKNLALWDSHKTPDPRYVKDVPGKGFKMSAIDAHYQVREMTRAFGPIGEGWKFSIVDSATENGLFMAKILVATKGEDGAWVGGPNHFGCAETHPASRKHPEGKLDPEYPKKAVTDGLTKCLSYYGICADVFLGEFDGNKYLSGSTGGQETKGAPAPTPEARIRTGRRRIGVKSDAL